MKNTRSIVLATIFLFMTNFISAQEKAQVTRIATITIDPAQLTEYKVLLKEQMETAVRAEKGVISYHVFADKVKPNLLTIIEVYADNDAYLAHREAAHFKKYKNAVNGMVQKLELSEVDPVLSAGKPI